MSQARHRLSLYNKKPNYRRQNWISLTVQKRAVHAGGVALLCAIFQTQKPSFYTSLFLSVLSLTSWSWLRHPPSLCRRYFRVPWSVRNGGSSPSLGRLKKTDKPQTQILRSRSLTYSSLVRNIPNPRNNRQCLLLRKI